MNVWLNLSLFHMTSQLKLLILILNFKKNKKKILKIKINKKPYYLNKCESERDDELFFASKVKNQTNSDRIIDK